MYFQWSLTALLLWTQKHSQQVSTFNVSWPIFRRLGNCHWIRCYCYLPCTSFSSDVSSLCGPLYASLSPFLSHWAPLLGDITQTDMKEKCLYRHRYLFALLLLGGQKQLLYSGTSFLDRCLTLLLPLHSIPFALQSVLNGPFESMFAFFFSSQSICRQSPSQSHSALPLIAHQLIVLGKHIAHKLLDSG